MFDAINNICENHYEKLLKYPNVIGVGNGYKTINNVQTKEPALCIMVTKKCPQQNLKKEDLIPPTFMGVTTDVLEVGEIFAKPLK